MKEVVPPYPSDVKEAQLTLLEKPLQIAVNTPVTISGLTSKTRYEAVVKVDKKSLVKLEADGNVVAEGELDGLPIYFAPTATSATITVTTFSSAVAKLQVKAAPVVAAEEADLPKKLEPNKLYKVAPAPAVNEKFIASVTADKPVTLEILFLDADKNVILRETISGMNEKKELTNLATGDINVKVDGDVPAIVSFTYAPAQLPAKA